MVFISRCRLSVDLNQLRRNAEIIRSRLRKGSKVCAVVKANAYGLGARKVVSALNDQVDFFAVATLSEAREVQFLATRPILILGPVWEESLNDTDLEFHYSVSSVEELDFLCGRIVSGKSIRVHLAYDSGMNRLGVKRAELEEILSRISACPSVELYGFFTHFCDTDPFFYRGCKERFFEALLIVRKMFPDVLAHACASSTYLDNDFDMVRAGISLYGFGDLLTFPCAEMAASVLLVKTVETGECVGYGCMYRAEKPRKIAVLSCGYADGYRRELGNRHFVLLNGQRCPVLGNICMDMMMVDVTDCDCRVGDQALLFCSQLPLRDMARLCGTIEYELLCGLGNRVQRVYHD